MKKRIEDVSVYDDAYAWPTKKGPQQCEEKKVVAQRKVEEHQYL